LQLINEKLELTNKKADYAVRLKRNPRLELELKAWSRSSS
jgi:hypothetical protein